MRDVISTRTVMFSSSSCPLSGRVMGDWAGAGEAAPAAAAAFFSSSVGLASSGAAMTRRGYLKLTFLMSAMSGRRSRPGSGTRREKRSVLSSSGFSSISILSNIFCLLSA